jgi:hypothetical protein
MYTFSVMGCCNQFFMAEPLPLFWDYIYMLYLVCDYEVLLNLAKFSQFVHLHLLIDICSIQQVDMVYLFKKFANIFLCGDSVGQWRIPLAVFMIFHV